MKVESLGFDKLLDNLATELAVGMSLMKFVFLWAWETFPSIRAKTILEKIFYIFAVTSFRRCDKHTSLSSSKTAESSTSKYWYLQYLARRRKQVMRLCWGGERRIIKLSSISNSASKSNHFQTWRNSFISHVYQMMNQTDFFSGVSVIAVMSLMWEEGERERERGNDRGKNNILTDNEEKKAPMSRRRGKSNTREHKIQAMGSCFNSDFVSNYLSIVSI